MLCFQQMQLHFYDSATGKAWYDNPPRCEFAKLNTGVNHPLDKSTIHQFPRLLNKLSHSMQLIAASHSNLIIKGLMLKIGAEVHAPVIAYACLQLHQKQPRQA